MMELAARRRRRDLSSPWAHFRCENIGRWWSDAIGEAEYLAFDRGRDGVISRGGLVLPINDVGNRIPESLGFGVETTDDSLQLSELFYQFGGQVGFRKPVAVRSADSIAGDAGSFHGGCKTLDHCVVAAKVFCQ